MLSTPLQVKFDSFILLSIRGKVLIFQQKGQLKRNCVLIILSILVRVLKTILIKFFSCLYGEEGYRRNLYHSKTIPIVGKE